MRAVSYLALFSSLAPALCQVALPSPPVIPPPAASGASTSPSTKPNSQWSTLLGNLLYFYEGQRSGKLPSTNRVNWRNSSALNDGSDIGKDLTGGYYDSGGYLKCTFPLSFVLTSVCWGAIEFGSGYNSAQQTAYLDDMLRWGLDWLIRAHPDEDRLVVQVGDLYIDNHYWGSDQNIPTIRPSYLINSTSPGTDAAAMASAAFSTCSVLYSGSNTTFANSAPASLSDANYASTLITHATQLYNLASKPPFATFTTTIRSLRDNYPSTGFQDSLVLAALMLGAATNSSAQVAQALGWYRDARLSGRDRAFGWKFKSPGLPVMFAQLAKANPGLLPSSSSLGDWQKEAEDYFDRIISGKSVGTLTKGGLLFFPNSDRLNGALNTAMLMLHYAPLATSGDKKNAYTSFARGQISYALGNNPMSVPYVVGSNPNSPSNPMSAPASGGSDNDNINSSPPQEANVLYGAVIRGPDQSDRYHDIRDDWPQTSIRLDFNAPMLTLAAISVMTESDDPFFTRLQAGEYEKVKPSGLPCDSEYNCDDNSRGLTRGGIIAIAVVISVVGLLIGLGIACVLLLRKRMRMGKI